MCGNADVIPLIQLPKLDSVHLIIPPKILFVVVFVVVFTLSIRIDVCGQRRPRSAAFSVSDQGLHCPLPESLNIIECINSEQSPG